MNIFLLGCQAPLKSIYFQILFAPFILHVVKAFSLIIKPIEFYKNKLAVFIKLRFCLFDWNEITNVQRKFFDYTITCTNCQVMLGYLQ
jgi:hypothetical protein